MYVYVKILRLYPTNRRLVTKPNFHYQEWGTFYDLFVRWCSQSHPRQTPNFLWLPSKIRLYSPTNEDLHWSGYFQNTEKVWENWSKKILLLTRFHSARRCNAGCQGKNTPSYPNMNPINFSKNLPGKIHYGVANCSLNLSPALKKESIMVLEIHSLTYLGKSWVVALNFPMLFNYIDATSEFLLNNYVYIHKQILCLMLTRETSLHRELQRLAIVQASENK